jgi:hypothetical protein
MALPSGDGCKNGGITGKTKRRASRARKCVAREAEEFCATQPLQPAALLSRHPPEPSLPATNFPHFLTPKHAMTCQKDK